MNQTLTHPPAARVLVTGATARPAGRTPRSRRDHVDSLTGLCDHDGLLRRAVPR